jgi:putative oxidoreductase
MVKTAAVLVARLIFAADFAIAAAFKFAVFGMDATAAQITAAGFPLAMLLAWVAGFFEVALAAAFLTGLFFSEAAIVAAAYVLFLGFSFHGPDRWGGNPMEFGLFITHFTFIAGLLFAAVYGPGNALVLRRRAISSIRRKS